MIIIQIPNVDLPKVGSRAMSTKKGQSRLQLQKREKQKREKIQFL